MKKLTSDQAFYGFSPELEPVLNVEQGEELVIETLDCFSGQLKCTADTLETLDWSTTNPASGPVYIEGVKAGDVVRVDLHEVRATGQSVMVAVPETGGLASRITEMETAIVENRADSVVFKDKVVIPSKPMLGVIGVAPAEGTIPNSTPGFHGGNMDCTLVSEGASVYFTAAVDGALFGCGDMHAVMGDGEIIICGAETPGTVKLTAQTVDMPELPTPFIENDDIIATIASAETCDEAQKMAAEHMHDFLTKFAGMTSNDAAMLMSLVGNLKFCQVVDPLMTIRFEFPKYVLEQMGYKIPR